MAKVDDFDDFPRQTAADWRRLVAQTLNGASLDTLVSRTRDGIAIQPLEAAATRAPELGGEARRWTVMQRADMPIIAAANRQMQEDLALGAQGITLVLPSSPAAQGHGVEAGDRDRLERLFEAIDIDLIHLRLDAGHRGFAIAPLLLALYRDRGIDLSRVKLTLGLDPLMTSAGSEALAAARDAGHVGSLFLAEGRSYHNAGATEAQELALALATAAAMVRGAPGDSMQRIGLLLAADADLFLNVAKFRAARLLWRALGERLGRGNAPPLDLHGETSWRMMTRQDPHSNLLRVALATMGAGLGGADHVTALPYTAALGLADGFARRMARNTQTILLE
ncbi:MAG TPA: methylmalonyl-CoA mutase family protein, partial [Aestuariivirgaceae bacterium]|nr:methylmalonyl-CoA mutase family protein [Aestuariivirgaceae bacterium]